MKKPSLFTDGQGVSLSANLAPNDLIPFSALCHTWKAPRLKGTKGQKMFLPCWEVQLTKHSRNTMSAPPSRRYCLKSMASRNRVWLLDQTITDALLSVIKNHWLVLMRKSWFRHQISSQDCNHCHSGRCAEAENLFGVELSREPTRALNRNGIWWDYSVLPDQLFQHLDNI